MIRSVSPFYQTPAFPPGSGPDFVNAAIEIETAAPPAEILQRCHDVEAQLGRVRQKRWGPRVIDIDILAIGEMVLPDAPAQQRWRDLALNKQQVEAPDELILPHPRIQDRAFVLVPLCDIAPNWRHPTIGKTAAELKDALDDGALAEVVRLE